jgi:hypothetical protein
MKPTLKDFKQALQDVKNVHNCPTCKAHLDAIKAHQEQHHQ